MLKPSLSSGRDVAVADVAYDGGSERCSTSAAARCGRSQRHRAPSAGSPRSVGARHEAFYEPALHDDDHEHGGDHRQERHGHYQVPLGYRKALS